MDLTSVPKSIDDALRVQRKYVIPRFQREYAWENEELQTIEYSNAIVHAFQGFRAPFSGKIVHIFPEQSAAFN